MNSSIPFLICHHNKFYRVFLKEMLSKIGFYHILDVEKFEMTENYDFFKNSKNIFFLIEREQLNHAILSQIASRKFMILEKGESEEIINITAKFGLERILRFPFSSDYLQKKIEKIIQ